MAVVRPTRSSPPYALIVFVFLWVLSTGAAIYFYIHKGKVDADYALAQKNFASVATVSERNSPITKALIAEGSKHGNSALGEAIYLLDKAKLKVAGAEADETGSAVFDDGARLDATLSTHGQSEMPAIKAIDNLSTDLEGAKTRVKTLEGQLAEAQRNYESAQKAYNTTMETYKKTMEEQRQQMDQVSENLTQARNQIEDTISKYESDKGDAQRSHEDELRNLLTKVRQAEDELTRATTQVDELQAVLTNLKPANQAIARDGDGSIIRGGMSGDEVYINVGRRDHVVPGLTFAVYDPRFGVGSGKDGQGKAAIEVMEVGDAESLARITRVEPTNRVTAGDIIANPVFTRDRNRKYKFVVFGDFDLDGDEIATPGERDRVIRMIEAWGGEVANELTTQTDYLVLGAEPEMPRKVGLQSDSDQTADLVAQRKAAQAVYRKLETDARAFSIPVLNSNRFLAMIGYQNQTMIGTAK